MRKLEIIEIENSYLNFFTPAVIVAVGYFLWNLIIWPLTIFHHYNFGGINIDSDIFNAILAILSGLLVGLIVYFVFIPRLNVLDVDYKKPDKIGFIIVLFVFGFVIFYRFLMTVLFEFFGTEIYFTMPWFVWNNDLLLDSQFMVLFLIYQLIINPLFTELVYRRTVIPLLEDRGLSPFSAVIISSFGHCLFSLPYYIYNPNYLANLYWFMSTFIFGFATGIIYILTRNVLFPILYATLYYVYRLTDGLGEAFNNDFLLITRDLIHFSVILVGLAITGYIIWNLVNKFDPEWIKLIKCPSVPHVKRGIIGFLVISFILVGSQILVTTIIDNLTKLADLGNIFSHAIFYLIAFSIPFWLTITSEYAQY